MGGLLGQLPGFAGIPAERKGYPHPAAGPGVGLTEQAELGPGNLHGLRHSLERHLPCSALRKYNMGCRRLQVDHRIIMLKMPAGKFIYHSFEAGADG